MSKVRILLVDDHQLVIDGVKSLLAGEQEMEIVGFANNGLRALELVRVFEPAIVLLDVDMPEMSGTEVAKVILKDFQRTKVIMLTMHDEAQFVKRLMESGVHGYLLKTTDKEDLLVAIKKVAEGGKYFSADATLSLLGKNKDSSLQGDQAIMAELTDREIEILTLIAEGLSNKEIGDKLFISHRTVDTHRTNLARKIGARNIAGIIRFAIRNGLITE